jgi:hypothetical protein
MQSEHLSNLHPGWVVGGWLVAVSVTAALYLGGVGLGVVLPGSNALPWLVLSMAGGFYVGGLFIGLRWTDAPILHGAALSLLSVLIWFFMSLAGGLADLESANVVLGLVLVQLLAASAGGRMGRRVTLARTDS